MLSQEDLRQIASKGISPEQIDAQLKEFETGFPFLRLEAAAAIGNGIISPEENERCEYIAAWNEYKAKGKKIVKFVPASGAASRMFKDMFAFLSADYDKPTTAFEKTYFDHIHQFAFFATLDDKCRENEGKGVDQLMAEGNYKAVVANMLNSSGLNYGQLPKGLLLFHNYEEGARTPMEEHLVEGALYAASNGEANVHFTVSHEHMQLFEEKVKAKKDGYAQKYGIQYNISFSEQKPSTDTVAANPDNTPFRTEDGKLLFRPGGHGALIENLNEIDADVIFIKNIDNVVPDRLKEDTVTYKQLIAGVLVTLQKKAFEYLCLLDTGKYDHSQLEEIIRFVQRDLCCRKQDIKHLEDAELVIYLRKKLNRPMRVCGVVKNVGEPGGGPFLTYNQDGTVSLQILESSQIDKSNAEYQRMFTEGTHFNPVDLVCAVKDYKGQPFNLPEFVDKSTGFISSKSKNGKELKALELPGLWNGAMSDWNTVFVEVPLSTFNPVKTVNDLLRDQHQ
jgi:putative intracellular protease/amidase